MAWGYQIWQARKIFIILNGNRLAAVAAKEFPFKLDDIDFFSFVRSLAFRLRLKRWQRRRPAILIRRAVHRYTHILPRWVLLFAATHHYAASRERNYSARRRWNSNTDIDATNTVGIPLLCITGFHFFFLRRQSSSGSSHSQWQMTSSLEEITNDFAGDAT